MMILEEICWQNCGNSYKSDTGDDRVWICPSQHRHFSEALPLGVLSQLGLLLLDGERWAHPESSSTTQDQNCPLEIPVALWTSAHS